MRSSDDAIMIDADASGHLVERDPSRGDVLLFRPCAGPPQARA
jgi:hypothetical protein